jgi:hypothetical protein
MLTHIHGRHVFECDACGETLETETKDFSEALRIMRSAEWRARQVGSDWVHTCFGCAEEGDRNARARRSGRIP